MANKLVAMIQTTIFIILAVLLSIILLNYFKINMNESDTIKLKIDTKDDNILKLNRFAVYEGVENIDQIYKKQIIV
jgi:hypothetical protein